MAISPISYILSKTDKNQTHLLPIPNSVLIILCHVQTTQEVHDVQSSKATQPDWCNRYFTKPNCKLCMEERLTILKIYVTNASRL